FIPQAIETAKHFHAENPDDPKFIWTTGAWLIWDHLNSRSGPEVADQRFGACHVLPAGFQALGGLLAFGNLEWSLAVHMRSP
ncbi:hypothetical protein ACCS72_38265, partial [Rhizobium ruizarguesonis]